MKSDIISRGRDIGKMALWLSHCWIVVLCGGGVSAHSALTPTYTINHTMVKFEEAMKTCSLTTLATEQEVAKILELVTGSAPPQSNSNFWVGLRKGKKDCVVPKRPLRGFKWVHDGSEETQVSRWMQEPDYTCTTVRCAILKVQVDQSAVKEWGLIPGKCTNSYKFICKTNSTSTPAAPELPEPAVPEPAAPELPEPTASKPAAPELPKPTASKPAAPELPEPTASKPAAPELPEPELPEPTASKPAAPELPEPTASKPAAPELPEPASPEPPEPIAPEARPPLAPGPCPFPSVLNSRAFTPDPNNRSRIQVECWLTTVRVELFCWGRPVVWRLLDRSPANLTSICRRCGDGFQKDTSGNCVDVDECSNGGARCRHDCVNTDGSFRCVCSDQDGKHHDEGSAACADAMLTADSGSLSHILIPVLVAVAALVVVVVVVAVTVKCCLMRRSKKRTTKDTEKMEM